MNIGVRLRGTLGDIDPLNKVPFKRAISRVNRGPLFAVSLILPRRTSPDPEIQLFNNSYKP